MNSNYAAARFGRAPFGENASGGNFAAAVAEEQAATLTSAQRTATATPTRTRPAPPSPDSQTAAPPDDQSVPPSDQPVPPDARPGVPRFSDVPEAAKYPLGPYRQAPPELGGEWWLVNPFTGETPWANQTPAGIAEEPSSAPAEFLSVFGERPTFDEISNYRERQVAQIEWDQNLEYFKQTGVPEEFTSEQVEAAGDVFESWGLGRPVFYEGRYGWAARFPGSGLPSFEASPFTAVEAPHLVVARYQVRLTQAGQEPAQRHPFVPPQVFGAEEPFTPVAS